MQCNRTRNLPLAKLYGRTIAANMWDGFGYGTYNSLQVTLNKSFSKVLFLKGAYTWGRYMNMAEDDGWAGPAGWNWEPMMARNYAPSPSDRVFLAEDLSADGLRQLAREILDPA